MIFDFILIFGMELAVVLSISILYFLFVFESMFEEGVYEGSFKAFLLFIVAIIFHGFHHLGEFVFGPDVRTFFEILSMVTFIAAIIILTKNALRAQVSIDVTNKLADELEKRTAELKDRTAELEESNRLKQLLIDILSHDLLNPVGVIKGASELLLEENQDETLKLIKQNSEKLIEMIKSTASLARLENVRMLNMVNLDLRPMLSEVIRLFKHAADEKKISIDFENGKSYPAKANPLIEEVFSNLVSNAIKYSNDNGKVIVGVSDAGAFWKVSVKDHGIGIDDKDKPKLFQRFQRIKREGVRGTGLGLAIAKRITEAHGGEIWVEDNPEGGSVFIVTVPKA